MFRRLTLLCLLVSSLSAQGSLEIVAAYYGVDRNFVDVTAAVRGQAQPDGVALLVGKASLAGDPFPGQLKTLRIYYKQSGQFLQGEWKDGENLLLGRLPEARRESGVRGGRPGATERSRAALSIAQATYGAGNRTVDVTSLLQSLIQNDSLDVSIPSTQFADPAPGSVKELVVSYQWAGRTREARLRDGERLRLPGDTVAPAAPAAPAVTGLRLLSAQYGSGTRVTDVTALLTARIANDRLIVLVDNNNMGGDPLRGADKTLNVTYEWNGQRSTASAREGQTLRLPPDSLAAASPRLPTDGVCFYPQADFQGSPICVSAGQDQARVAGPFSSLKLFGTVRQVELFESPNFTGRSLRLTADLSDLSRATSGFFSSPVTWAPNFGSLRFPQ